MFIATQILSSTAIDTNCPHCGQKRPGWRIKASAFYPAPFILVKLPRVCPNCCGWVYGVSLVSKTAHGGTQAVTVAFGSIAHLEKVRGHSVPLFVGFCRFQCNRCDVSNPIKRKKLDKHVQPFLFHFKRKSAEVIPPAFLLALYYIVGPICCSLDTFTISSSS